MEEKEYDLIDLLEDDEAKGYIKTIEIVLSEAIGGSKGCQRIADKYNDKLIQYFHYNYLQSYKNW